MNRHLRAVARLTRCVVHCLHGIALVQWHFEAYDAARREDCVRWWSSKLLRTMGVAIRVDGVVHPGGTLLVANHISWLDIHVLHAVQPRARFVSKSDVRHWPLLSRLADAAGTLYLERERKRDALRVVHEIAAALGAGAAVAVFPEGTTSDGHALLPFHANLLQAAIATGAPVQPIALRFADAKQTVSPAVEYIGTTSLLQSLWRVACGEGVVAHVALLPVHSSLATERRALAEALRADIATRLGVAV